MNPIEQLTPTQIKFKAWDNIMKFMLLESDHDNWIDFSGDYWTSARRTYDTPNKEVEKRQEIILLQFIGLHDKNKKEIYVGDIYKYNFEYDSDYDGDMPIVKTAKGLGFVKDIYDRGQIIWAKQEGDGVEIIGNIFENPELLHSQSGGGN